jgi:hypothetical protein
VLPDDGTWRPRYVGAFDGCKINNINNIGAFVDLFYIYDRMHGARIKMLIRFYSRTFQEVLDNTELDRCVVNM